jgi:hypothetical protein
MKDGWKLNVLMKRKLRGGSLLIEIMAWLGNTRVGKKRVVGYGTEATLGQNDVEAIFWEERGKRQHLAG